MVNTVVLGYLVMKSIVPFRLGSSVFVQCGDIFPPNLNTRRSCSSCERISLTALSGKVRVSVIERLHICCTKLDRFSPLQKCNPAKRLEEVERGRVRGIYRNTSLVYDSVFSHLVLAYSPNVHNRSE